VATHAINPWLYSKMPYDAERDFIPITLIANVPNVLVLETAFAARNRIDSVPAFVQYLRAHPGQLSFGSGGNGSAGHLAGELFKMQTGTFAVHIPYRGAAPAQLALQGGEIQFMFDNLASAAPRIRDGRIRALAVTTRQAANAFPELKPLASAGVAELKSFDISTWFGLFAPANTPAELIERLHGGFTGAMQSRAFRDLMATLAAEPSPTSPREFAALIAQESRKYQAIVRHAKATVD
jgi:tripartite-type tricarboxylate transporter receptor subunit TctC